MTARTPSPTASNASGAPNQSESGGDPARVEAQAADNHPTDLRSGAQQPGPPAWQDRLGAVLLSVCAAGAIVAVAGAVDTVSDAAPAARAVETWRLVGYAYFAGVFVLLALAPRQLRGLWELTILAKLALPLAGATILRGSTDAGTFVVADGFVTAVLIVAYVLMAGWTAPGPHRWPVSDRRDAHDR